MSAAPVNCQHWSDGDAPHVGRCAIGHVERPSRGFCAGHCPVRVTIDGAPVPKPQPKSCGGCSGGAVEIVRWIGVRWFGVPAPVRHWRFFCTYSWTAPAEYGGCGCIFKLKLAKELLGNAWRLWRAA